MARRRLIQWCAFMAAAVAVMLALGGRMLSRSHLAEGMDRAEAALRLTTNGLAGHLRRYEALPELLADDDDIRAFLTAPQNVDAMNIWLRDTNAVLQSSDLYILDEAGITIAASNFERPDSFIGEAFTYRPYFTEAIAGRNAQFYALGTTSGVRGYYYSAPVRDLDGTIAGVLVFKIGLDTIEESWRGSDIATFVTDPEGIVFMSSDPSLLYGAMLPMEGARAERTSGSRRYSDAALAPLAHRRAARSGLPVIEIGGHEYLEATHPMPGAGWTVHALLPSAPLLSQARTTLLAGVLLLIVGGTVWGLVLQRRAQLAERLALQASAQEQLERRVQERTADLARLNRQLRRTQADLVQAGKLAALGQMSAALSHEINQPLAAARNYAESAAILIARGDPARASQNVAEIVALIDRMAAIAQHLRDVARRPNRKLDDLDIAAVIAEAGRIAAPRIRAAGAEVTVSLPDLPLVRGAAVGLQQVLVNLLANAADAVEGLADRRIEITAAAADTVTVAVRDHGPGVPPAIADRIFDPFFSTKPGAGLGLGLSISYNIMKDLGGDLSVSNHPEGGAVFSILLRPASVKMAAE